MIDAISAGCRTASIRSRKRSLEDTETHPENQAKNNQKMRSMRRLERHLIIKVIIEIGRRSTLIPLRPATARPGFSRPRRAAQQHPLGGKAVQHDFGDKAVAAPLILIFAGAKLPLALALPDRKRAE